MGPIPTTKKYDAGETDRESEEDLGMGYGSSRGALSATSPPPGSGLRRSPRPSAPPWRPEIDARAPLPDQAPRMGGGCFREEPRALGILPWEGGRPNTPRPGRGRDRVACGCRSLASALEGRVEAEGICFPTRLLSPPPSTAPRGHPCLEIPARSLHCGVGALLRGTAGPGTTELRARVRRDPAAGVPLSSLPEGVTAVPSAGLGSPTPPGRGARRGGAGGRGGDLTPPPPPPQRSPPPPLRARPPRPAPPPPRRRGRRSISIADALGRRVRGRRVRRLGG